MANIDKVQYTANVHTTGGRDGGSSRSSDGRLDLKLAVPGLPGTGTNPEQLLAAGWSACFLSAVKIAAAKRKVALPANVAVDAEIDLVKGDGGHYLQARINLRLPGIEMQLAQELANEAEKRCPYSKATRGNISVAINVDIASPQNDAAPSAA